MFTTFKFELMTCMRKHLFNWLIKNTPKNNIHSEKHLQNEPENKLPRWNRSTLSHQRQAKRIPPNLSRTISLAIKMSTSACPAAYRLSIAREIPTSVYLFWNTARTWLGLQSPDLDKAAVANFKIYFQGRATMRDWRWFIMERV